MVLEDKTVGFAMTGSYCTFSKVMPEVETLMAAGANVQPIMSENAASTDTRFGKADDFKSTLEFLTGNEVICSIQKAEPIGPKKLLDVLVIAPCTGNTLAKLANGIADTAVTLAAKSHLRNGRPVVVAISSNDALSQNAKSIGILLNTKHFYFVPFEQDNPAEKPNSIVAVMSKILPTVEAALKGKQLQPILEK